MLSRVLLLLHTGNVMDNAETLPYFVLYYTLILALCVAMFQRVRVLKVSAH